MTTLILNVRAERGTEKVEGYGGWYDNRQK